MSASLPSSTVNSGNHPIGRTTDSDKAVEEKELIETLREEVEHLRNSSTLFSASNYTSELHYFDHEGEHLPLRGMSARHVRERIIQLNQLDNKPRLNTSSYVNVVMEPEEEEVALLGLGVNLADGSVYPSSVNLHDTVVNMIAKMWHAPIDASITDDDGRTKYTGAGTVGSTEACLLAGLALKFRWREWYRTRNNLSKREILGVIPNVVISTCYQAAWEKFFRYMDVEPRFVKPSIANKMRVDASDIAALCDDKTLGVVGILGNHYNGAYDPIWDIDSEIDKVNKMNGWQIGIHVDAASGGFIAPFQQDMPPWDFRLPNVLSISTSGHKFGESSCGTGWVVFRHRENLAEHISISVSYLGGKSDSYTLNFSRPATATYVQYYKILRLGYEGYRAKVRNQMSNTKYLRDRIKNMKSPSGEPWFEIIDGGDNHCLPVLGARLNPKLDLNFDDIDIQHGLAESHWYVSGYCLSFPNPANDEIVEGLLTDVDPDRTMFRVVVKSNLDMTLAQHLANQIEDIVPVLSRMEHGMHNIKTQKEIDTVYSTMEMEDHDINKLNKRIMNVVQNMNTSESEKEMNLSASVPPSLLRKSFLRVIREDDGIGSTSTNDDKNNSTSNNTNSVTDAIEPIKKAAFNAKKTLIRAVTRLKIANATTNQHGDDTLIGRNSFAAC